MLLGGFKGVLSFLGGYQVVPRVSWVFDKLFLRFSMWLLDVCMWFLGCSAWLLGYFYGVWVVVRCFVVSVFFVVTTRWFL